MSENTLLFTEDIQRATQEIVALGGQVTQQFTDNVFVASLPESVDPESLTESTPEQPEELDPVSQLAADAWQSFEHKSISEAPSETEGLSWDTPGYEPPNPQHDEGSGGISLAAEKGP